MVLDSSPILSKAGKTGYDIKPHCDALERRKQRQANIQIHTRPTIVVQVGILSKHPTCQGQLQDP